VAGDAALLVDPRSIDDIAAALERLADDATLRERLRGLGLAHAARFTWEHCAQKTLRVLSYF
jgi:glycosyltransferase involved in cell wall biosynthesis